MRSVDRRAAVQLRRQGLSYRELQAHLHVAKSTLWRWLQAEGLVAATAQQRRELRQLAQHRAAQAVHRLRLERTAAIIREASQDVGALTVRELRLIGAALYWAEGAKQKEQNNQVSEQVVFVNSDPRMVRLFVKFLEQCCQITAADLTFRIYLHETASALEARTYWGNALGLEAVHMAPITWKRHQPVRFRRDHVGARYHGLLRVIVRKSSGLNRRITGWIQGMCAGGE